MRKGWDENQYNIQKKLFGLNQEDQDQYRRNGGENRNNCANNNSNHRKHNKEAAHRRPSFVQSLRNLAKGSQAPQVQKRYDYDKQKAKNQDHFKPQEKPRGGKLYQPKFKKQKEQLDQQIQVFMEQPKKVNLNQVDSDEQTVEIDLMMRQGRGKVDKKPLQAKDLSSLSFSYEFSPIQTHNQAKKAIGNQQIIEVSYARNKASKTKQLKEEHRNGEENKNGLEQFNKKAIKQQIIPKQLVLQNLNDSWGLQQNKKDSWNQELGEQSLNIQKLLQSQNLKEEKQSQVETSIKLNEVFQTTTVKDCDMELKDQGIEQSIKAADDQNQQDININQLSFKIKAENQQQNDVEQVLNELFDKPLKKPCKIETKIVKKQVDVSQTQLLARINDYQSQATGKLFITFQVLQNILAVTIKEIDLLKLQVTLNLDSNGKLKLKNYQSLTQQHFDNYIKFSKTSHYFPKMGIYRQEDQYYTDLIDSKNRAFDETNQAEFQFCKIKLKQKEIQEKDLIFKNVLSVRIISILCMNCGTKNQVAVLPHDLSVVCSCRGNNCSEKMFGKISSVRVEP